MENRILTQVKRFDKQINVKQKFLHFDGLVKAATEGWLKRAIQAQALVGVFGREAAEIAKLAREAELGITKEETTKKEIKEEVVQNELMQKDINSKTNETIQEVEKLFSLEDTAVKQKEEKEIEELKGLIETIAIKITTEALEKLKNIQESVINISEYFQELLLAATFGKDDEELKEITNRIEVERQVAEVKEFLSLEDESVKFGEEDDIKELGKIIEDMGELITVKALDKLEKEKDFLMKDLIELKKDMRIKISDYFRSLFFGVVYDDNEMLDTIKMTIQYQRELLERKKAEEHEEITEKETINEETHKETTPINELLMKATKRIIGMPERSKVNKEEQKQWRYPDPPLQCCR